MLEPGDKNVTVNAALDNPLGLDSTIRECRKQRQVAATVSGYGAVSTLAFGRTSVRVIAVWVPASSIKTSLLGSSRVTACHHAALASGSCSLATKVFFSLTTQTVSGRGT